MPPHPRRFTFTKMGGGGVEKVLAMLKILFLCLLTFINSGRCYASLCCVYSISVI